MLFRLLSFGLVSSDNLLATALGRRA